MDPITTAIIEALADLSKDAVKHGYNALKSTLKKKFGQDSDLVDAVDKLEKNSYSKGRKATLQEEIEAVNAHQDPEIIRLAQALLDEIQEQSPAQTNTITRDVIATGEGGAAVGNVEGDVGSIGGIHAKK